MVGYCLMSVSIIFNGFFYAYEQYLFAEYSVNPIEMLGYEGMFGMMITFFFSIILSNIPCFNGQNHCVYNENNEPYMESPLTFFR